MPTPAGPVPVDHVEVGAVAASVAAVSTQHVHVPVRGYIAGVLADVGSLPVRLALPAAGVEPSTWYTAGWEVLPAAALTFQDAAGIWHAWPGPVVGARVTVGPDGGVVTLVAGAGHDVWVELTLLAETVRLNAGTLAVV